MCGRYYIEIDAKELQDIISEVEKNTKEPYEQLKLKISGEIFPADTVPVQTGPKEYRFMKWGFIAYNGKPVINARSETALEKPMFKNSMLERRCLIPASGYYEWQRNGARKTKYQCFVPNRFMYFAGCWRQEKNSPLNTFVILTRPAAASVEAIHDRMPVIIPQERSGDWLNHNLDVIQEAVTKLMYKQVL